MGGLKLQIWGTEEEGESSLDHRRREEFPAISNYIGEKRMGKLSIVFQFFLKCFHCFGTGIETNMLFGSGQESGEYHWLPR